MFSFVVTVLCLVYIHFNLFHLNMTFSFRPSNIRVDAFDPELYLTTWEIDKPVGDWTTAVREEFMTSLSSICTPPCRAGISKIAQQTA